jgi:gamma-glutamylputrescine oxidase
MISIWEKESFFAPQDVVIVGSGFVGLWSAYHLVKKHPRARVTIIDRGTIPTGASTRNAGFACFGSLSELVADAAAMGTEKMLSILDMRFRGLERIQKTFSKKEIGFDLCGGYELYGDGTASGELAGQMAYINALIKPVTAKSRTFQADPDAVGHFGFGATPYIVRNNLEGALHSGKLVKALLQRVQSMGVQVLTGLELTGYTRANGRIELHLNKPIPLTATSMLLCPNAFTKALAPELDIVPARGQVLVTSPIPGLPVRGTFHAEEGYYYFRNLGDRILLGGARHKAFAEEETMEMSTSDGVQGHLEAYLDEVILPRFRGSYSIEHRWSGIMAMGSEKSPIVKELEPGVHCAVRMSGMGVALAPVVSREIARNLL